MSPQIEEAWRALRLADRDIYAFNVLSDDDDAHLSVVCFHAQQAVEKSLKAVLFALQIEFKRTHNLLELAALLCQNGGDPPLTDESLLRLNPYAVTYRYDDRDIELVTREDAALWMNDMRAWAEVQVGNAAEAEHADDERHD